MRRSQSPMPLFARPAHLRTPCARSTHFPPPAIQRERIPRFAGRFHVRQTWPSRLVALIAVRLRAVQVPAPPKQSP